MGKYHLPDGETLVTDLQCLVVYTPDDPVYRQALWGAISQLTKFWMWEPDGSGGEHDAADSWDLAYAATLESFDMLQQLLDAVDDVEDLLRALQTIQNAGAPCCEHLAPDNEAHAYDDSVYPDTPPSTWGDGEPIADASDWEQLVCGAAHAYVDHLKGMAQQLDELVGAGAIVVGTVAGILGLLSGAGIILAVGYGSAAGVVTGLLAGATETVFGDVPADIEAAREDIVCAIVHESSTALASEVQGAISTLAWDLFYSFVDYGSARNIMLEGSHGSEFLGVNRRTDCDCSPGDTFYALTNHGTDFDGLGPWTISGDAQHNPTNITLRQDAPDGQMDFEDNDWGDVTITVKALARRDAGSSGTMRIDIEGTIEDFVLTDSYVWYEVQTSGNSLDWDLEIRYISGNEVRVAQTEIIVNAN